MGPALSNEAVDHLLASAIRGDTFDPACSPTEVFLKRAEYHGVTGLLSSRAAMLRMFSPGLREALRQQMVARTAWELMHQNLLSRVQAALTKQGIEPIIFKGTALAYSLYPEAAMRTRADSDIIVPLAARARTQETLTALGFAREDCVEGDLVTHEMNYSFDAGRLGTHSIDLHWRLNNSELLSRLFDYDEIRATANPLPRLCSGALGMGPVQSLIVACIHRSTHKQNPYYFDGEAHYTADRLIWLYDIHLLSNSLSLEEWDEMLQIVAEKGLRRTCWNGLSRARSVFGTAIPEFITADLADSEVAETVDAYLNSTKLHQDWMDFRALDTYDQFRFLRELLLPGAPYMRKKFPKSGRCLLPFAYAWRALSGLNKRLKARANV